MRVLNTQTYWVLTQQAQQLNPDRVPAPPRPLAYDVESRTQVTFKDRGSKGCASSACIGGLVNPPVWPGLLRQKEIDAGRQLLQLQSKALSAGNV
jgi:hypothetical protein